MSEFRILVVAKAPVAGQVKTRLCERHTPIAAAQIAAASLLDTLDYCERAVGATNCHLALAGDLRDAVNGSDIAARLANWTVYQQRGADFGERLANAHRAVGGGSPVVQIGMDTPQLTVADLESVADGLRTHDAVVAGAVDGGWWALGLRNPDHAAALRDVPMSTPHTGRATVRALQARGLQVTDGPIRRDLDWHEDAEIIAQYAPHTRFAKRWSDVLRDCDTAATHLLP